MTDSKKPKRDPFADQTQNGPELDDPFAAPAPVAAVSGAKKTMIGMAVPSLMGERRNPIQNREQEEALRVLSADLEKLKSDIQRNSRPPNPISTADLEEYRPDDLTGSIETGEAARTKPTERETTPPVDAQVTSEPPPNPPPTTPMARPTTSNGEPQVSDTEDHLSAADDDAPTLATEVTRARQEAWRQEMTAQSQHETGVSKPNPLPEPHNEATVMTDLDAPVESQSRPHKTANGAKWLMAGLVLLAVAAGFLVGPKWLWQAIGGNKQMTGVSARPSAATPAPRKVAAVAPEPNTAPPTPTPAAVESKQKTAPPTPTPSAVAPEPNTAPPTPTPAATPGLTDGTGKIVFPGFFKTGTNIFWFKPPELETTFLEQIKEMADQKTIEITGFISESEANQKKGRVAISRAWAVQRYLQRKGVTFAAATCARDETGRHPTNMVTLVTIEVKSEQ